MKLSVVETIYETNANSIVDMLRQAAGNIEAETDKDDKTEAMIAVQIMESGAVEVYGWGKTDVMNAIASLHLGASKLISRRIGDL